METLLYKSKSRIGDNLILKLQGELEMRNGGDLEKAVLYLTKAIQFNCDDERAYVQRSRYGNKVKVRTIQVRDFK